MEKVQIIRNLSRYLPEGDILLAGMFIDTRDFESLKELVDSAIIKVRRNLKSDKPKAEYVNLDMDSLTKLKSEVDMYIEQLDIDDKYVDDNSCDIEYYV